MRHAKSQTFGKRPIRLRGFAAHDFNNTILIPHTPTTLTNLSSQIRNAIVMGTEFTSHASMSPTKTPGAQK
jgi:hypothetical protein